MEIDSKHKEFASKLAFIMDEAHRLGLHRTGHRIHDAVRELGWEMQKRPVPYAERKWMYCNTPGVKD